MKSLLLASLWALLLPPAAVLTPGADACLLPAFRLPAPQASYLRSFHWLRRDRRRTDRYDRLILMEAQRRRLNPRLLKAVIAAESGFDPAARSPAGARGLMQVMPATALEVGYPGDLDQPELNIAAGAAYLQLLHRAAWRRFKLEGRPYADAPPWVQARIVAAYNAGPSALSGKNWCRQTKVYVEKVSLYFNTEIAQLRLVEAKTAAR